MIIQGDCIEKLKTLPENSVDSIVTDPPAGISFMGKEWDTFNKKEWGKKNEEGKNDLKVKKNFEILPRYQNYNRDNFIAFIQSVMTECLKVLKPGGHAFVWTLPRTSHWTAIACENVGFEIRDVVAHVFGSGFPKSLNIGKAVDKLQCNEREEFVRIDGAGTSVSGKKTIYGSGVNKADNGTSEFIDTKGTSSWEGWGTALKPAREDWILMRKPLEKGLTVAENVLKWGTGGINIDESRVETNGKDLEKLNSEWDREWNTDYSDYADKVGGSAGFNMDKAKKENAGLTGRFPANLLHDNSEEVRECFPETKSSKGSFKAGDYEERETSTNFTRGDFEGRGDSGNASRFFKSIVYIPKASKSERNKGCEKIEPQQRDESRKEGNVGGDNPRNRGVHKIQNNHPTVKPVALMRYLIKMITPPKGIVLDPFMGSGSTGIAAKLEGFDFIGIEKEPEYVKIAEARIKAWEKEPQQDKLL
jgi:site-specific DNA-methyltransferase (adenine-specific)